MAVRITFPGGKRVAAFVDSFEILTDQPEDAGGDGAAPSPFDLFLASLGACTGYFVLQFCRRRAIPTDSLEVVQHREQDPESGDTVIRHDITLPDGFPEKYRSAVLRAAEACSVKRVIAQGVRFETRAV